MAVTPDEEAGGVARPLRLSGMDIEQRGEPADNLDVFR
jgi:hypothetical protein